MWIYLFWGIVNYLSNPCYTQNMLELFQLLVRLLLIVIFIRLFFFLIKKFYLSIKNSRIEDKYPYEKTNSILTPAEQNFYLKLKQEYGENYYIFPQVGLDKIIQVTDQENFYQFWNKINRKSIDFVIVNKEDFRIVKLIELNDSTHNYKKRKERDAFLQKICDDVGLDLEFIGFI